MTKLQSYFVLLWIICLTVTSCHQSDQPVSEEAGPTQQAVITPVPTYTPTVQSVVQQGDSGNAAHEERAVASSAPPVQASTSPIATATATRQPTPAATRRPTAAPTPRYYVNGSANLRSGPGTNYDIVGGRQPNDVLSPIARTEDGEWIQIDSQIWIWARLVEGEVASLPVTHDLPEPVSLPSTANSAADLNVSSSSTPAPGPGTFNLQFFNNVDLTGSPVLTQVAPVGKHLDWGSGSPGPQVYSDNFSARMEGTFDFVDGAYRFYLTLDDGARLYIDGELLIDAWFDYPVRTKTKDIELTPGSHHVLVEYYERGGLAELWLRWQPLFPTTPQIAPATSPSPAPGSGGYTEKTKWTMFDAIWKNDLVTVRNLIATAGFPHFHYDQNQTALHYAANRGALEIMTLLLQYPEADPNLRYDNSNGAPWDFKRTPLHEASENGHAAVLELLLSHGADPAREAGGGYSALHLAARSHRVRVTEILLKQDVEVNGRTHDEGNTPIHYATYWRPDAEVLKLLLTHRHIDPNWRNYYGDTPLHRAAANNYGAQVAALLEHPDTDPNVRDDKGRTALLLAVIQGYDNIAELLLEHRDTDPNIGDLDGWTPLIRAVYEGSRTMVRHLLRHDDIDVTLTTNEGHYAFLYAKAGGHDRIAEMIEEHIEDKGLD